MLIPTAAAVSLAICFVCVLVPLLLADSPWRFEPEWHDTLLFVIYLTGIVAGLVSFGFVACYA